MKSIASRKLACCALRTAQQAQVTQGLGPWSRWRPAGQLDKGHGMRQGQIPFEQVDQSIVALPKVVDPHRGVDQHPGRAMGSSRRLDTSWISALLPPKAARRLAACTLTKVCMTCRKGSDLSTDASANSRTLSYKSSSIVTVVLIAVLRIKKERLICITQTPLARLVSLRTLGTRADDVLHGCVRASMASLRRCAIPGRSA